MRQVQSKALPYALLLGGAGGAFEFVYEAAISYMRIGSIGNWGLAFACACLVAALGCHELLAMKQHGDQIGSE